MYNIRDILGHFVRPKSAKGDMCPHSCCQSYRVHPNNMPAVLPRNMLRRATDEDLAQHYNKHASSCPKCEKQVLREMDRRDRVAAARRATGERNRVRAQNRHEYVEHEINRAEAATNGYMLNSRGRARGVSERSLFYGSEAHAIRYASEELRRYWDANPRPTAASMSQSARVRRGAASRSDLSRVGGYGYGGRGNR